MKLLDEGPIQSENPGTAPSSLKGERFQQLRAQRFARYSLLLLVLGVGAVFFNMIKAFLVPIVLAAVFASLFYPFYEWLLRVTHGRRGLSALICCLALSIGAMLPAYGVARLIASEAIRLYQKTEEGKGETARGDASPAVPSITEKIQSHPLARRLHLDPVHWQSSFEHITKRVAELLAAFINRASRETFEFVSDLFLTFFTMFYFFRDGPVLLNRLKHFSPLSAEHEDEIIRRFVLVSRATLGSTLLVGLIKGLLGGLTFWAFGIEAPALWGVVMVFLSILPVVGAWVVMYPAAAVLMIQGQVWQGIALFLIALIVVGSIDNVLEPFLIGRSAAMHDLVVFFSMLGGIGLFGVMGFIVGPILAALFFTLLDIYGIEFSKQLGVLHAKAALDQASAKSSDHGRTAR